MKAHQAWDDPTVNRTPFLTPEEERATEQRIDNFMAEVLIPLAAQTNAIVLTPFIDLSILTVSLMRMFSVQRSKWGGKPPFTIICAPFKTTLIHVCMIFRIVLL